MSKGLGSKIGIKFTEDLVGDINLPISAFETQNGDWSANGSYSSSPIETTKDGDISSYSYWQSRSTANYIQIAKTNTKLVGIKVYKGSSYRPTNFVLRTSADGVGYSDVKTGSFVATTGWETIMFDEPIISDYFRINFGYSSRLYLYELVLIVEGYNNEVVNDFVITGQEYLYANGPLIDKRYKVVKYERHPTEPKSILLTIDWWNRFNNVEGEITIAYDATKSSLSGQGGAIDSFETSFSPVDLVQAPNPGIVETITGAPTISINYLEVTYHKGYAAEETITAAPAEITVAFLSTDVINP